jgi:hypothetical protein
MDLLAIENENTHIANKWDLIKLQFSAHELLVIYSALEKYQESIKKDIETQYGGHENYSLEDDTFLGELLSQVSKLMIDFDQDRLKKYTLRGVRQWQSGRR